MWTYKLKNAGNGFIVSENENNLCDVFMTNDPKIAKQRARLISAAPDLLEAAKRFTDCDFDSQGRAVVRVDVDAIEALRAAVRKAEGARL